MLQLWILRRVSLVSVDQLEISMLIWAPVNKIKLLCRTPFNIKQLSTSRGVLFAKRSVETTLLKINVLFITLELPKLQPICASNYYYLPNFRKKPLWRDLFFPTSTSWVFSESKNKLCWYWSFAEFMLWKCTSLFFFRSANRLDPGESLSSQNFQTDNLFRLEGSKTRRPHDMITVIPQFAFTLSK